MSWGGRAWTATVLRFGDTYAVRARAGLKPAPTTARQLIRMSWGGRAWTGRFSGSGIQRDPVRARAGLKPARGRVPAPTATQLIRMSWGGRAWTGRFSGSGIQRGPRPYDCHAIDQTVRGWSGVGPDGFRVRGYSAIRAWAGLKPAPTTATQLIRMSWGGRAWTGRFSGSGIQRGPSAGGFETRPYNCHAIDQNVLGWSGVDRTVLRFGDTARSERGRV